MASNDKSRLVSLDLLRGFAILIVLLKHCNSDTIPNQPELHGVLGFTFWKLKYFGSSGVDLFFVLSGFLVGGLLLQELQRSKTIDFVRFWLRREFKILPSYYLLLFVLGITGATHYLQRPSPTTSESLFIHALFLQNYLDPRINVVTWSLAVEEHFYFLLPIALLLAAFYCRRRNKPVLSTIPFLAASMVLICLGLRIFHASGEMKQSDELQSHFRFDSLFIGVYCQYLWQQKNALVRYMLDRKLAFFALALLLISPAFFDRQRMLIFTLGFLSIPIGYAIILLLVVDGALARYEGAHSLRWVAAIGRWSYNIYIWHFFLPYFHIPGYHKLQTALGNLPSPILGVLCQMIVFMTLSVIVGFLFTLIVEDPFLKLRNRLFPSRSPRSVIEPS